MNTLEKIKSRGYWEVVIRPKEYMASQVADISNLFALASNCSVYIRGWDYPHISNEKPEMEMDRISQSVEFLEHIEKWVFFQSGQFVHYCGIYEDWNEKHTSYTGKGLNFIETLIRFIEIYEFAARLSMTEAGSDDMHISITLHGLKGRRLITVDPAREMLREFKTGMEKFSGPYEINRDVLTSDTEMCALKAVRELFIRFNWDVSIESLKEKKNSIPFLRNI